MKRLYCWAAVRRVVGRVQIDRDAPDPPQPAAVALDNTRRQLAPHDVERAAAGSAFSNRDSVGCEASDSPATGSRPSSSLWMGSSARCSASLQSGWPPRCRRCAGRSGPRACAESSPARAMSLRHRATRLDQPVVDALGRLEQDRPAVGACLLLVELGTFLCALRRSPRSTIAEQPWDLRLVARPSREYAIGWQRAVPRSRANPSLPTTKLNQFRISGLRRQKCSSGTTNAYEPGKLVGQTSVLRTPPGCGSTPSAS